jgi:activator of HSP90 ATPase
MAKFDESDPRWIVQAREDGTNVNQWHWSEKDCSEWSKQRLGQLLGDLTLLSGPATAKTTGLKSLEGDSILNVSIRLDSCCWLQDTATAAERLYKQHAQRCGS